MLRFNDQQLGEERRAAVAQSVEIVRRRIDETGTLDPTIQIQGQDRILVQLPGVRDPERIKALLGRTAKMNFHLLDPQNTPADVAGGPRAGLDRAAERRDVGGGPQHTSCSAASRSRASGCATPSRAPTARPASRIVNFRFNAAGARQFGDVTQQNVGQPSRSCSTIR